MTYEQFKTTFPVGSSLKIFSFNRPRPRHVVAHIDAEKIVVLKWWRGPNYGWEYEVYDETKMMVWKDHFKKV